jgi:hypothetical protein
VRRVLLAAVVLLAGCGGEPNPVVFPPRVPTPTAPDFVAPPRGSVVFGGAAGKYAVGLAVVPLRERVGLQVSLATIRGLVPQGLPVTLEVDGREVEPDGCGRGCYRAVVDDPPKRVAVHMRFPTRTLRFEMPKAWPPREGASMLADVERLWRGLRTLVFHESISTAGSAPFGSTWRIVAPDRLSVEADDRTQAKIIIGDRSWYRVDGSWTEAPQIPVRQPVPFWAQVTNAHVLASTNVAGQPAWRISFFDPKTPAWMTVEVAKATLLPLRVRMIAAQHYETLTYRGFDEPQTIRPPVE